MKRAIKLKRRRQFRRVRRLRRALRNLLQPSLTREEVMDRLGIGDDTGFAMDLNCFGAVPTRLPGAAVERLSRRVRLALAVLRYEQASTLLAGSTAAVDEEMLADDELEIVTSPVG